jgi:Flp pilus assembly protein TadG
MARGLWASLKTGTEGVSTVEFALVAPVFLAIFVPMIDYGLYLNATFRLNSAVSAASNYALVNAGSVGSANGATLAQSIAQVVSSDLAATETGISVVVVVNNGPVATATGASIAASGTASAADSCYCPTLSGTSVTWGSAKTCATTCSSGGPAGKFVSIAAKMPYTSLFGSGGLATPTEIASRVVLEAN